MGKLTIAASMLFAFAGPASAGGPPTGPERFGAVPSWRATVTWVVQREGDRPIMPVPGMKYRRDDKANLSGTLARCPDVENAATGCPGGTIQGQGTRYEETSGPGGRCVGSPARMR